MSSKALAVQRQSLTSLSVPGALFSPSELQIGYSTSQDEFMRIGKALSSIDTASDLWQCDFALHGMRRWGKDDGIVLAAKATGLSQHSLRRCARIAERFTPEKRYPGLTRSHYRRLLPFDAAQIDAWLPTVILDCHSASSLYALAAEKFGKPEKSNKQYDRCTVHIREIIWARLAPLAPSRKVVLLVEMILEEWLKNPPDAQAIALSVEEMQHKHKSENRPPCTKESREKNAERMRERRAEAKNDAVRAGPSVPNEPEATTLRPTKSAARAKPIKRKPKELRLQWVPCSQGSPDAGVGGRALKSTRAQCFPTEAAARAAEEAYFQEKGYHNEVIYCVKPCGAYHVRHAYSGESQRKSPTGVAEQRATQSAQ
jgi:hypothetical protein